MLLNYILGFVIVSILATLILITYVMVRRNRAQMTSDTHITTAELDTTRISRRELAFLENDNAEATLEEIGRGGSATVYRAHLQYTMQQVAIKKIVMDDTAADYHHLLYQLQAETDIGKLIRHRNVVPLLARVSTPRCVYLIYDYIHNGSLRKLLREGDNRVVLDWSFKYKIALGVANGLEYLHHGVTPNVIHRDLKPDNILLDQDMEARIADFGLATSILDSQDSLDMPDNNGTLGYMDPVYFSTRVLSRSSDVLSFGIFLAEMLTLRSPSSFSDDTTLVQLINEMKHPTHPTRIQLIQLMGSRYETQVLAVLDIATWCTRARPSDRPNSHDVRIMLENCGSN